MDLPNDASPRRFLCRVRFNNSRCGIPIEVTATDVQDAKRTARRIAKESNFGDATGITVRELSRSA